MAPKLQLKFEADQEHQVAAVESVAKLFEGQERIDAAETWGDDLVANTPYDDYLEAGLLEEQLRAAQDANGLPVQNHLQWDQGFGLEGIADGNYRYPNFTIEMETGTGKTYVYLRTIYELHRRFAWSKFVIVVPSIAIFEGVVKNVEVTRDHFRALFGNEPFDLIAYDGGQLSRLRGYATSNTITVLLITLDAFNKAKNNLYRPSEKLPGERLPYQYIQETRPILILDEPQNMESELSKRALRTLRPLFALRYSATHRTSPNLVYRLSPADAYQRGLVKHIQVDGVVEVDNANIEFLALVAITLRPRITAEVRTRVTDLTGTREVEVTLRQGDDLGHRTNRPEYAGGGFVVENIDAARQTVEFRNGRTLYLHGDMAPSRPVIFREQIRSTIRQHMEMQTQLRGRGIKVLSLFFIDRVANYTAPDGLIRTIFDEEYERLKYDYEFFRSWTADQVRSAYFAQKKHKDGREEAIDTDGRNADEREAEKRAFALIMRDKERLLTFGDNGGSGTPVCFIFAHSALKEGWDNPNVFQICTLAQTTSEIRKRQEIGRGLRLAVNQAGERVRDEEVNILTIVANESFSSYADRLQQEYVEDGATAPAMPTDKRNQKVAVRNPVVYDNPDFLALWEKLNHRVRYRMNVDTPALIDDCVALLNKTVFPGHVIEHHTGKINLGTFKIRVEKVTGSKIQLTLHTFDAEGEPVATTRTFKPGDNVARILGDERLRSLGTVDLADGPDSGLAMFTNTSVRLAAGQEFEYTPEGMGSVARERRVQVRSETYPVFNLIDRAAKQTGLTRPTVNTIFRRMAVERKGSLFINPEGFASVFSNTLRNALADHIARRIEFIPEPDAGLYDLEKLFPPRHPYTQKEVVEAGEHGLYNLVQKDSEVEQRYVEVLRQERDAIVFYFKFPDRFSIDLPDLIGNYRPDWGVARVHRNGAIEVRTFVHETKGTTNLAHLRFPHERRKIECAERYFAALNINYRPIDPSKTGDWWVPTVQPKLLGA